jgi:glycosyltransferase involved in cell wall biosynthesis
MQVLTTRPFAKKLVSTQHSAMPHFRSLPNLRWRMQVNDRFIDRYIAVSDAVNATLVRDVGIAPSKIELIDYGIPASAGQRDRAALRAALAIPQDAFTVGYFGRLVDMKNVDVLIDAAARVPEIRLELVGEGPDRAALEQRARSRGAHNVTFHGWRNDSRELVLAFDLVALVSDFEGKPLSMLEAMLAGVSVMGSDVSGTRDALGGGELGSLVPPRDVDAVVAALRAAIAGPTTLRERAARAKTHADLTYSAELMTTKVLSLYERLADA